MPDPHGRPALPGRGEKLPQPGLDGRRARGLVEEDAALRRRYGQRPGGRVGHAGAGGPAVDEIEPPLPGCLEEAHHHGRVLRGPRAGVIVEAAGARHQQEGVGHDPLDRRRVHPRPDDAVRSGTCAAWGPFRFKRQVKHDLQARPDRQLGCLRGQRRVRPYADGAAALLLVAEDALPENFAHARVRISGSGAAIDALALHDRPDPLDFSAARVAAEAALEEAGVSLAQMDIVELWDSFSIAAVLQMEAIGMAPRGTAWKQLLLGDFGVKPALLSMGGNKARGFPLAAAGVYQAAEAALQLRGTAGACQVSGAKSAFIQALGGQPARLSAMCCRWGEACLNSNPATL